MNVVPLPLPTEAIRITADLHIAVDAASAVLIRCPGVFCRAGQLVHVIRTADAPAADASVRRPIGSPTIRAITIATLREILTRAAIFEKFDKRSSAWVHCIPTDPLVSALHARGQWPSVRPLVGVIEAPSLRPDGTIIQEPGYDAATGLLYAPNADFLPVLACPTHADVARARDALLEVVCDVPFSTPAHRSAWLAFVLTLFARPAIDGCVPLFAMDATTRGSGKGKLVNAAVNIATGRDALICVQPDDDDEMRKRISSLIFEGERIAVLDNLRRPLGDPSLDAALTATEWKDRVLGRSENQTARNHLVWAATGNNIEFGGDCARRSLAARIESPLENPEDRDPSEFAHPELIPWVREQRPRLVQAALTMLRGYYVSDRPPQGCKSWGSFEGWSRLIPSVIVWAGLPDPMTVRATAEATADTTKQALVTLLALWQPLANSVGEPTLTTKTAIRTLYPDRKSEAPDGFDDLRQAIEELVPGTQQGKPPNHVKFGYVLRRHKRRVIGGKMLDCVSGHAGVVAWYVKVR